MNLANKITIIRIILTIFIASILLFPVDALGINSMKLFINELLVIDIKYIIAGVLFIIAAITDFIDGYIARKKNLVTDLGKMLDSIADKVLLNTLLIILSTQGLINPIIPVIIICRDIIVDAITTFIKNKEKALPIKSNKIQVVFLIIGIALTLFNNLPFELINIKVSDILIIIGTVLSIYSAIQYYYVNKKIILETA